MTQYKAPRGTHDIYGQMALALEELDKISRNVFRKHNFKEKIPGKFLIPSKFLPEI